MHPECRDQPRLERLQGNAGKERLANYLRHSDAWTVPALSQRVELSQFAEKILEKGVAVVATTPANQDIGVAAFYCNDQRNRCAFLTHLAVDAEYRGLGVATALLDSAKAHAKLAGMRSMLLEVYASNSRAKKFYASSGFSETTPPESDTEYPDSLFMSCVL